MSFAPFPHRALTAPPMREWRAIALAVALSIISFALLWYQAYGLNQAIQLAYVNHWVDPSLYPRDPFPATGVYYISLLWKSIAALTAIVPLRTILLVGMVLERFLSIYSAGRIARSLVGPSTLPRVAAMSIMTIGPVPLLGAGTTMPNYFEQSGLAMAVLLFSFSLFLDRKYLLWGVFVGLTVNLNALYAAYAVGYCAVMFFIEQRPLKELRQVAAAALVMLLVGSPLLVYISRLPPQHPFNHDLWWQAMQVRSSHHLMPLTWPQIRYAEFALTIILPLMIAWFMRGGLISRFAVAVAFASVACLSAAFVVAYAIHIPRLLTLQPIRGTDLGYCLTDIIVVCAAALWFQRSAANAGRAIAILPVVLLACLWPLLPVVTIAIAMVAGIGIYLLMTWAMKTTTPEGRIRFATVACLISLCVAAAARPALTWQYTIFNTGDRWPVSAAADWASRATPKNALFLLDAVDDRTEPFRALSRRSVFVHVKDGTVLFTDMDYLDTWRERMELAGYPLEASSTVIRYPQWRDAEARALHRSARVDYWLVAHDLPSSLPVVWQDKTFKILDLD